MVTKSFSYNLNRLIHFFLFSLNEPFLVAQNLKYLNIFYWLLKLVIIKTGHTPLTLRLGNLGGMKGRTRWAPGLGARGTKSSSVGSETGRKWANFELQ